MYNMTSMNDGFDLLSTTFAELQVLGINWIASIILIFITIIIISRQVEVWQYLGLSVTMAWSVAGLNIPKIWTMLMIILFTLTLLTSRLIQDRIKASINVFKSADEKVREIRSTTMATKARGLFGNYKSRGELAEAKRSIDFTTKNRDILQELSGKRKAIETSAIRQGITYSNSKKGKLDRDLASGVITKKEHKLALKELDLYNSKGEAKRGTKIDFFGNRTGKRLSPAQLIEREDRKLARKREFEEANSKLDQKVRQGRMKIGEFLNKIKSPEDINKGNYMSYNEYGSMINKMSTNEEKEMWKNKIFGQKLKEDVLFHEKKDINWGNSLNRKRKKNNKDFNDLDTY